MYDIIITIPTVRAWIRIEIMVERMDHGDQDRKSYHKVVEYVNRQIRDRKMKAGDRLPAERELAEELNISRNSVREGLRVLEIIGILESRQGSGNYIAMNFDGVMTGMLASMYVLKGITENQLTEYRFAIEWEAMHLAVLRVDEKQKEVIREAFRNLQDAKTEEERVRYDRAIHQTMVDASKNEFLITSYRAITDFMDGYIRSMRRRIIAGMQSKNQLEETHRLLVEGIIHGDLATGLQGIRGHFNYIEQYKDFHMEVETEINRLPEENR